MALVESGRALVLERWGAFVLHPADERTCRLHARSHTQAGRSGLYTLGNRVLFEPARFLMERRMLLGIKARAEAAQADRDRDASSAACGAEGSWRRRAGRHRAGHPVGPGVLLVGYGPPLLQSKLSVLPVGAGFVEGGWCRSTPGSTGRRR